MTQAHPAEVPGVSNVPGESEVPGAVEIREAIESDLSAIVALLADDELGAARERPGPELDPAYRDAFAAIARQDGNQLLVAIEGGRVVGCLQLTIIPTFATLGATRAQVEGVRITRDRRGRGLGALLMQAAIARARQAGAKTMQLTTNTARTEARRFYGRLGFVGSHIGMKRDLGTG